MPCYPDHFFQFRYAFPFEGNWNLKLADLQLRWTGSDTLSRLKGIETQIVLHRLSHRSRSDTLSRLKGIETSYILCDCHIGINSSDTLSRLKGIETWIFFQTYSWISPVQIRFPVWRELKLAKMKTISSSRLVSSDTLSRLKGIETGVPRVDAESLKSSDTLSRLKGIETAWVWWCWPWPYSSDTLSRLKGIETVHDVPPLVLVKVCSDTLSRLKGIETLTWD